MPVSRRIFGLPSIISQIAVNTDSPALSELSDQSRTGRLRHDESTPPGGLPSADSVHGLGRVALSALRVQVHNRLHECSQRGAEWRSAGHSMAARML